MGWLLAVVVPLSLILGFGSSWLFFSYLTRKWVRIAAISLGGLILSQLLIILLLIVTWPPVQFLTSTLALGMVGFIAFLGFFFRRTLPRSVHTEGTLVQGKILPVPSSMARNIN